MSKIINCDLCGTPCTIEGEVTHYYKPVDDVAELKQQIAELTRQVAVRESACMDMATDFYRIAHGLSKTDIKNYMQDVSDMCKEYIKQAEVEVKNG